MATDVIVGFNSLCGPDSAAVSRALGGRYCTVLSDIAGLASHAGYSIEAFGPDVLQRFSKLSESRQHAILSMLETYREICVSAIRRGVDIRNDGHALAWWAIRSLGLKPGSDVFSHLQEGDIVEIYDNNHMQIFRTFNFLQCVSYSLDEVHTYEWWQLYERDESLTAPMVAVVEKLVKSPEPLTLLKPFPRHFVREKFSRSRKVAEIESRFMSTLVDQNTGEPRAYLNVFRLLSLSTNPS